MLILCYARLVDAFTFFCIFPFLPSFVQHVSDVPEEQLGYYAGLVESMFAFTQCFALLFWSKLSGKWGRKPALAWCLFGMGLNGLLFGLSKSIGQMLLFRGLAGVFSASTVTVRVATSEISTTKTRPRAFSYLTAVTDVSLLLAPLAGGALYDPVLQYPGLGLTSAFLASNPASLACFFNGTLGIGAALCVVLFFKETLPPSGSDGEAVESMTYGKLLRSQGVVPVLTMVVNNWFFGYAGTVNPVFWYTSVKLGGWGFSTQQISILLAVLGVVCITFSLTLYVRIANRFGHAKVVLFGAFGLLVNYICFMLGNAFLRLGMAKAFFCVLPVWLLLHGSSYGSSDTSLQLALNSAAPPGGLSLLNGLAYSLGSVEKMVLPVASSSLYAFGVERQILWGNFLWAVLLGLLCIHSFVLVKHRRYLTAE